LDVARRDTRERPIAVVSETGGAGRLRAGAMTKRFSKGGEAGEERRRLEVIPSEGGAPIGEHLTLTCVGPRPSPRPRVPPEYAPHAKRVSDDPPTAPGRVIVTQALWIWCGRFAAPLRRAVTSPAETALA
jgi:hypothetical protein